MKLKVNPTRMELLRLKRRLKIAQKGHKLLKEKRDGLMKEFMSVIKIAKKTRIELEDKLSQAFQSYTRASSSMSSIALKSAYTLPSIKLDIQSEIKNVMSVKIPRFSHTLKGDWLCYGYLDTSGELDRSIILINEILPTMIRLSEIEKSAQMLAAEIEKTRRRVNALEHVLIPNITQTIKYISMKLSEQERSTITISMRIKELINK